MLQAVSPRVWLPTMQIVWGVLTFWYVRPRPAPLRRRVPTPRTQHKRGAHRPPGASPHLVQRARDR